METDRSGRPGRRLQQQQLGTILVAAVDIDGTIACHECLRGHVAATGVSLLGMPATLLPVNTSCLRRHCADLFRIISDLMKLPPPQAMLWC